MTLENQKLNEQIENIEINNNIKYNSSIDRRSTHRRWLILLLVCISTLGDYYCIDNVAVLHDSLKLQFNYLGDNFEYYFGLLYSLYSLPNIILPFLGGILVMKYGIRAMYLVFGLAIIIGQFIFSLGCQQNSMNFMLIGRIIFGLGGECINICQNAMIVKWFYKSEIALPLGLTISVSRLGSVMNDVASPIIIRHGSDSSPALWVGFGVCVISFLSSMILSILDQNQDKKENYNEVPDIESEVFSLESVKILKQLNTMFWLISIICMTLYGAVLPFNYIASGFLTSTIFSNFQDKQLAQEKAGVYMSIPFFISAFMVPIYGIFVDKFGQRAFLTLSSAIVGLISFGMFYYLPPIYGLILLGMTYSMFASVIWPAISLVIKNSQVGFAYGITTSLQNTGLAIFPIIVATIYSRSKNYYITISFFIALTILSIILSIFLIGLNAKHNNIINKTEFDENDEKEDFEENEKLKDVKSP